MNERITKQIEEMKKQTIGVEVEMNNITREKAARKVAEFFGTTAWYAAGEYGYMRDRMIKNASWSHRSFTTKISNFSRN